MYFPDNTITFIRFFRMKFLVLHIRKRLKVIFISLRIHSRRKKLKFFFAVIEENASDVVSAVGLPVASMEKPTPLPVAKSTACQKIGQLIYEALKLVSLAAFVYQNTNEGVRLLVYVGVIFALTSQRVTSDGNNGRALVTSIIVVVVICAVMKFIENEEQFNRLPYYIHWIRPAVLLLTSKIGTGDNSPTWLDATVLAIVVGTIMECVAAKVVGDVFRYNALCYTIWLAVAVGSGFCLKNIYPGP